MGASGDLLGQYHSMHELWDLAQALSYQVGQMQKAVVCGHAKQWDGTYDAASKTWISSNADVTTWLDNWNAAYANFGNVLDRANAAMGNFVSWALWDIAPATDLQGSVFDALVQAFEPFDDLNRRLADPALGLPKECIPTFPHVPQPTAPDFRLDLYKMASAVTGGVEGAGAAIKSFLGSDGMMLFSGAVILVAGAVITTQVVTLLPRAKGR